MPIWLELLVLALLAYAAGLALGWLLWGRTAIAEGEGESGE
jgi:hypothetical protein